MVRVGERLHKLRTDRGFTLEDVATAIGSSKQQVFRIEKGQIPSAETVSKLALFFSCSSDYLLGLVDDPTGRLQPSDLTPQELRFVMAIRGKSFKEVFDLISAFIGDDASITAS